MSHLLTRKDLDACPLAACGQAALAAILDVPLRDVQYAVPEGRSWMSHKDMREALEKLDVRYRGTGYEETRGDTRTPAARWPERGLVWIQFRGPWEASGVPRAAALQHSHWVAVGVPLSGHEALVFDVNALDQDLNHGWLPRSYWEKRILAPLIATHKRATGEWYVRAGIEVSVLRSGGR